MYGDRDKMAKLVYCPYCKGYHSKTLNCPQKAARLSQKKYDVVEAIDKEAAKEVDAPVEAAKEVVEAPPVDTGARFTEPNSGFAGVSLDEDKAVEAEVVEEVEEEVVEEEVVEEVEVEEEIEETLAYEDMKYNDLKYLAKDMGLKTSGSKADLVKRIKGEE